jgi:protein-L-isoaspartate O-methyltransferase
VYGLGSAGEIKVFVKQKDPKLQLISGNKSSIDATGMVIWPASFVMCHWLCMHRKEVENRRVLELGSGCGLAGVVAAKLGGIVTITDGNNTVLKSAKENLKASGVAATVGELQWGAPSTGCDPYTIIFGADLCYVGISRQVLSALFATVGALLAPAPHARFVMVLTIRADDAASAKALIAAATEAGFAAKIEGDQDDLQFHAALLSFMRSRSAVAESAAALARLRGLEAVFDSAGKHDHSLSH